MLVELDLLGRLELKGFSTTCQVAFRQSFRANCNVEELLASSTMIINHATGITKHRRWSCECEHAVGFFLEADESARVGCRIDFYAGCVIVCEQKVAFLFLRGCEYPSLFSSSSASSSALSSTSSSASFSDKALRLVLEGE